MTERYEVRFITPQGVPNPKQANTYSDARFMRDAAKGAEPPRSLPDPQIVRFTETVIPDNAYPRMLEPLNVDEVEALRKSLRWGMNDQGARRVLALLGIFE